MDEVEDVSRRCDQHTGKLRNQDKYIAERKKGFDQMKGFSVTRRVKRSEVTDGTHVRMRAMASEKGDRVCWMKVNQHERHEVDAGTNVLKRLQLSIAGAASQRRTEHGHRKITTILDTAIAFAHTLPAVTNTEELIYAHSSREAEPDCFIVWLLLKALYGPKGVARSWPKFFRNEAFTRAEWNAEVVKPHAYHEAVNLDDIDDTSKHVHRDGFMVKSMEEHKVISTTIQNNLTQLLFSVRKSIRPCF